MSDSLTKLPIRFKPIIFISGGPVFADNAALAKLLSMILSSSWTIDHASGKYKGVAEESLMLQKEGFITPEEYAVFDSVAASFNQECYLEVCSVPFGTHCTTRFYHYADKVGAHPCKFVVSTSEPEGDYTRCGYLYMQVIDED